MTKNDIMLVKRQIIDEVLKEYEHVDCTATGNLDHSLKQDCDTITILLKGEFRGRNEENSPLSLKQKSCLRHSVVKVHKQNSVGAITSANNSSRN